MTAKIDSEPDPMVAALQAADSLLIDARLALRPVLLLAEQRQRMKERRSEAKAAQTNGDARPEQEDERLIG